MISKDEPSGHYLQSRICLNLACNLIAASILSKKYTKRLARSLEV